jgi:DNA invertase Pin-like site-specific DNA recombinase
MNYGYARVSTDGQSVEAQVRQLTNAGCERVFREVASGAKTDRAQLCRLLGRLSTGDVLTVTRLDRLARSTRDLLRHSWRERHVGLGRPDLIVWFVAPVSLRHAQPPRQ